MPPQEELVCHTQDCREHNDSIAMGRVPVLCVRAGSHDIIVVIYVMVVPSEPSLCAGHCTNTHRESPCPEELMCKQTRQRKGG